MLGQTSRKDEKYKKKQIMITLLKTLLTIHYVNSLFNALKLLIQTSAAYLYDKLDKR